MLLDRDEYGLPRRKMVTRRVCLMDLLLLALWLLLTAWPLLVRSCLAK